MSPIQNALPVLGIYLAAVVSPGPNFYLLAQTTLAHSRRAGLLTALGFSTGAAIFVAFGFLGITAVIGRTPILFTGLRLLGGAYILGIGLRIVWRRFRVSSGTESTKTTPLHPGADRAFTTGLITMLTNPKAGLLMLSLFTSAIDPDSPAAARWIMAAGMPLLTLAWHSSVALLLSHGKFRRGYGRSGKIIEPLLGLLLIYFGFRILLTAGTAS